MTARRPARADALGVRALADDPEGRRAQHLDQAVLDGPARSRASFCLENVVAASSTPPARRTASCGSTWRARSSPQSTISTPSRSCASATTTSGSCCRPTCTARRDDVKEAVRAGDRVRLCKGAYRGAAGASRSGHGLRSARRSRPVPATAARRTATIPAIATHDEELVRRGARAHARGPDRARALRVPDALRPAPEALGGAGRGRRLYGCACTCRSARTGSPTSTAGCASGAENVMFVLRSLFAASHEGRRLPRHKATCGSRT